MSVNRLVTYGYILSFIGLIGLVLWAYAHNGRRYCLALDLAITPTELGFVQVAEVGHLMERYASRPILGQTSKGLVLDDIETQLQGHTFIEDVHIYRLHDGNIRVQIAQKEPLARVWFNSEVYLSDKGVLFPLSEAYTAWVPVVKVEQSVPSDWASSAEWAPLYGFLQQLHAHPFWHRQVAYVHVAKTGELRLHGQIGDQVVHFGAIEGAEEKLRKLWVFYTQILPSKGWGKYKEVDLRFNNQIVCK